MQISMKVMACSQLSAELLKKKTLDFHTEIAAQSEKFEKKKKLLPNHASNYGLIAFTELKSPLTCIKSKVRNCA